jgi:hypothetical protein
MLEQPRKAARKRCPGVVETIKWRAEGKPRDWNYMPEWR